MEPAPRRQPLKRYSTALYIALACLSGLSIGLGIFTFHYGHGTSYLRDDPKACANCHIMREVYDSWQSSSHRGVATCNSCHTPADFFGKYKTKAVHGIRHSWGFTTGRFVEPIEIKADSIKVVEANCRGCHADLFNSTDRSIHPNSQDSCLSCHRDVAHMR